LASNLSSKKIIVVGGGPAGIFAAIRAARLNQNVILIEKNATLGKKLLISGKGRCNLTNTCDLEAFLARFSKSGQFLRDAFKKFFNRELMDFFELRGLKLKVERQERVFPQTDRSASVLEVLKKELDNARVKVLLNSEFKDLIVQDSCVKGVVLSDGKFISAQRVIMATGGASYPGTGSDGSAFEIIKRWNHHVTDLEPGLVPLLTRQHYPLEGLTLKNIRLRFSCGRKELVSEIGELLFTHFGISGPLVLTLSGIVSEWLKNNLPVFVEIDFKPALTVEQLDARLLREFKANPKKGIKSVLKNLLPLSIINVFLKAASVAPEKKVSHLTQAERKLIIDLLKGFRLDIIKTASLKDAIITRGGVSLKEVNPRTMESRLIRGLYLSGEMLDVDADTGGFNLQAAFSTGYLAGESASS
jgi:predicted Rossmann fold flavoprotein